MSETNATARRARVERNIYRQAGRQRHVRFTSSATATLRAGSAGSPSGGIMAARAERDDVLGRKGRGERVQPNPRLRFGEAADAWLAGQVTELRPTTQAIYTNAIETHLRPRWGRRRLDAITVEDVADLVRELRRARQGRVDDRRRRQGGEPHLQVRQAPHELARPRTPWWWSWKRASAQRCPPPPDDRSSWATSSRRRSPLPESPTRRCSQSGP